jgi:hypothetical protein
MDVPHTPKLNTPKFTVELWAKVTGGAGFRSPLTSRADLPQRGYIIYATPANTWQFWSGKGDSSGWDILAGPPVVNNSWVHLAGVHDGTKKFFYVNGSLVSSNTVAFAPNNVHALRIGGGATEGNGDFFFQGGIDEVVYYDKALSADEIRTHYLAGSTIIIRPVIVVQPTSTLVSPGASVTLNVGATGSAPLRYQWKRNGTDISGATSSSLILTNLQSATAGSYSVVVSNPGGSVTSQTASITIAPQVRIYSEIIRATAPVSFWRLGEASGQIAVDSVGRYNGSYLNGAVPGVPGSLDVETDTAVHFDRVNRQKIDVPFAPALNSAVFTAEMWTRVTGGAGLFRSPLTSRGDLPPRGYIFYADTANRWQFWTGNGAVGGWDVVGDTAIVPNAWTHLAGTFDGTTKRFYVNGVEVGRSTPPFGVNDQYPLRIGGGATEGEGDYFFEGDVDEVAIYSKVLSASQIAEHYAARRSTASAPSLKLTLANRQTVLTWSGGTLQDAVEIAGPWRNVDAATSPHSVTPTGARRFYRVQQ